MFGIHVINRFLYCLKQTIHVCLTVSQVSTPAALLDFTDLFSDACLFLKNSFVEVEIKKGKRGLGVSVTWVIQLDFKKLIILQTNYDFERISDENLEKKTDDLGSQERFVQ